MWLRTGEEDLSLECRRASKERISSRLNGGYYTIAMIAVVLLLVIVIIYQQILKNKKIQQSNYKYLLQKLKQNLMDMQQNIAQHEEVIAELKQKTRKPCRGNRREGTGYRGHEDGEGEIAQLVVPAKCPLYENRQTGQPAKASQRAYCSAHQC